MFKIVRKKVIGPKLVEMDVHAPLVSRKAQAGQFIILRVDERGERIPLTIADFDRKAELVKIIFQQVGFTTDALAQLEAGQCIHDFVGPLGMPSEMIGDRVLCIGGGVGTAVVFPQVKRLHQMGVEVDVIIGGRSREYVILEEQIKPICHALYVVTDDGSYGYKGFVTDQLKALITQGIPYDRVLAIGPVRMMKAVADITRGYGIKTTVSLNPIMVDGTGMCGGCRVTINGQTQYACVDGPDFDGHAVDFDEIIRRQGMYIQEEAHAYHPCGGVWGGR